MLDEPMLRNLFETAVRRSGAFGAQLSIIKRNQQVDFAAGLAHAERGVAMNTDTLMQIGSITKVFNATIVMSLVQEGVLDLDTPIRDYIPTFEVADPIASRALTLRHLLSMSSGLDNGRYVYFGSGDDALGRYVDHLKSLPQQFPPGKYYGYSNAGACIAGHVAALVARKSWETLLRERILRPGGLNRSAALDEDLPGKCVSSGHYPDGGELKIMDPMFSAIRARAPSGSCLALATGDLARFGKIFIKAGVADTGVRILSEPFVERMMSPQIGVPNRMFANAWWFANAWCIGPCTDNWNGIRIWGHYGGTGTSLSSLHWIPEREGVIAFMVNTPRAMAEFSRIAFDEILQVAFGFSRPSIDVPEDSLTALNHQRYVGTYEQLGLRVQVIRGRENTLRARFVPQRTSQELAVHGLLFNREAEHSAILTPLGGDRFLVNPLDDPNLHADVFDTAFFGDDGEGRATNVLNFRFAMHRVKG